MNSRSQSNRWPASVLIGILSMVSGCAYMPLDKHMPLNQAGRFLGVGFSDGYHECDPRFRQPRARLDRSSLNCSACQSSMTTSNWTTNQHVLYQVVPLQMPTAETNAKIVPPGPNSSPAAVTVEPNLRSPSQFPPSPFPGPKPNVTPTEPNGMETPPRTPSSITEPDHSKVEPTLLPEAMNSPSDRRPEMRNGNRLDTDSARPSNQSSGPPAAESDDDDLLVPLGAKRPPLRSILKSEPSRAASNRYAPMNSSIIR